MKQSFCLLLFMVTCLAACKQDGAPKLQPAAIAGVVDEMTDIMVHDITNPPLASRFFSYACIAGYEVVSQNNPKYKSLHAVLKKYPDLKKPDSIRGYSYPLAAVLAMIETAKKLQPSGTLLEAYQTRFLDSCSRMGYDDEVIEASKKYALAVSKKILSTLR